MSVHNLPAGVDIDLADFLIHKYLRAPSGYIYGNGTRAAPTAIEFTPDLSAAEQTTLADIAQRYQDAKADYDQYETLRSQLKTFLGLASPSNAQTLAALKVVVRIVIFMMDTLIRRKL